MNPSNGQLPVLPIRNTVLFPGVTTPLRVGRQKSVAAIQAAQARHDGWVVVVTEKDGGDGRDPSTDRLFRVGVLGKIERARGTDKAGYQVLLRGVSRFRIDTFEDRGGYLGVSGAELADVAGADARTTAALLDSLKALAKEILELLPADTSQLLELIEGIHDLTFLTHLSASNLELETDAKQKLLETVNVKERTLALMDLMSSLKGNLEVQGEIRDKLSSRLGKLQRETILREQLKAIREELGEGEDAQAKDDYRKKIEDAGMPEEVRKVALEELKRLETIGNQSPETHVIRNYLDLMIAMPWSKSSDSELDIVKARAILEADHYGLEKVKKRIIQHLAVMKLKRDRKGSILLLVGPPGVGKTSIGQSIAKALDRKFVRASLGGVRDDAEIRGHRRTYIGAMPGRIVQSLKRAGENNPVMMLDEIDKLSRSFQGDPASALLEVLDPEQNANFLDHYLDVPFDLSKVFFIATANTLESIPGPLLDRMEVIEVSGYTTAEKLHIAKRHLIPKAIAEHGLGENFQIGDEALMRMITHYTREAGVRELARVIANACRASAEKVALGQSVRIELADLDEIFGSERYMHEVVERIAPPGVATGLAWTPAGGDILFIEASQMPGTGKLTLTGQLGDVMKESAQIALSLVRSKMSRQIPDFHFEKSDVHIHVPAGAIPKDGPSAGVTLLTAVASLLSGRRVSPKLALTGEVTLRGAVMPVGGIKEKVIAAHRAGIERIILSKRNQKDLRDVPEEVRSQLRFEFVETAGEVLRIALGVSLGEESVSATPAGPPGPAPAVA
ncbi:MAG TPA: endopeptidase La [Bdellovibrionota bacterium]|nr:endopeptidase La [Bdellovibrionota bacterium]